MCYNIEAHLLLYMSVLITCVIVHCFPCLVLLISIHTFCYTYMHLITFSMINFSVCFFNNLIVAIGWLCLAIRLAPYYIRVVYSLHVNTPAPPAPSLFLSRWYTLQTKPFLTLLFIFLLFPFLFLLFPNPHFLLPFILSPPLFPLVLSRMVYFMRSSRIGGHANQSNCLFTIYIH